MSQDVKHVVFDGVLAMEMKVLLGRFMLEEIFFSLDLLNERILNFTHGRAKARYKPPKPFQISQFTSSTQKQRLSGQIVCLVGKLFHPGVFVGGENFVKS